MKKVIVLMGIILLLTGCAAGKQAYKDYQTGNNTAQTNSETTTPKQQAQIIGNTVKDLPFPFAPIAGSVVTFLAGIVLTWHRGVVIRKNSGTVPATTVSNTNMFTGLVQDAANIFSGAFTTATSPTNTGSVFQRVWKTLLATVITGAGAVATDPALGGFLASHPVTTGVITALPSIILGIEKALSGVPAIAKPASA